MATRKSNPVQKRTKRLKTERVIFAISAAEKKKLEELAGETSIAEWIRTKIREEYQACQAKR